MGPFLCCDLVLPLLPVCSYLLFLLLMDHHVHRYDVTGDGAGIGQTCESRTIQPCKRHNETMTYLLCTCRKSVGAGLLQWNIGYHNIRSEEQRRLQAKNFWT